MAYSKILQCVTAAIVMLAALAISGRAQDSSPDHSCTVNIAAGPVWPHGKDGNNFNLGWNLQAGGGFAVSRSSAPDHGYRWFINVNYMYAKLDATRSALAAAITLDPAQLSMATSAHGSFSAVTFDPTLRYRFNRRVGIYGSGGFGWFRRGIGFNGANPANLLHASASSLDRLASSSGVFDFGGGLNLGLTHRGGAMGYAELRFYHGAAVNSSTSLLPVSFGVRW